jgi:hypothetical protein
MEPRAKSALLWGLVGALALLALVQAYRLFTGEPVALPVVAAATLVAGVGAAVGTYVLDGALAGRNERA